MKNFLKTIKCNKSILRAYKSLLQKYNYRCNNCGSGKNIQIHHIVPYPIGTNHTSNLVVLCKSCHMKAHRMTGC
ncbi:MAG: HNH endonuclease [Candidatus Latescibacteria bacterium]|nr:HNH endonuclease [Candidatus Latescibacterota bacterium]